jgi:hypothetical protein
VCLESLLLLFLNLHSASQGFKRRVLCGSSMFLSKAKAQKAAAQAAAAASGVDRKASTTAPVAQSKVPDMMQFIASRDYVGAVTVAEVRAN